MILLPMPENLFFSLDKCLRLGHELVEVLPYFRTALVEGDKLLLLDRRPGIPGIMESFLNASSRTLRTSSGVPGLTKYPLKLRKSSVVS